MVRFLPYSTFLLTHGTQRQMKKYLVYRNKVFSKFYIFQNDPHLNVGSNYTFNNQNKITLRGSISFSFYNSKSTLEVFGNKINCNSETNLFQQTEKNISEANQNYKDALPVADN